MEFGRVAENGGRDMVAREAYREAARLSPASPEVAEAVHRLDERRPKLTRVGGWAKIAPHERTMKTAWFFALIAAICFEGLGRRYLPQVPSAFSIS